MNVWLQPPLLATRAAANAATASGVIIHAESVEVIVTGDVSTTFVPAEKRLVESTGFLRGNARGDEVESSAV